MNFVVLDELRKEILLGLPFLCTMNPQIDWQLCILVFVSEKNYQEVFLLWYLLFRDDDVDVWTVPARETEKMLRKQVHSAGIFLP